MLHHDRETAKLLVRERHEALRQDALPVPRAPQPGVESRSRRRRLAFRRLWVGLHPASHAS